MCHLRCYTQIPGRPYLGPGCTRRVWPGGGVVSLLSIPNYILTWFGSGFEPKSKSDLASDFEPIF